MFHIECFVDDKNLAKVKWALFELGAYNVVDKPVKNNKPGNGAYRTPLKEMPAAFVTYAKKHKLKEFRARELAAFVVEHGFSESSCGHVRNELMRTKTIVAVRGTARSQARYRMGAGL